MFKCAVHYPYQVCGKVTVHSVVQNRPFQHLIDSKIKLYNINNKTGKNKTQVILCCQVCNRTCCINTSTMKTMYNI